MNKQGKGKIETCDYTWNPISGCLHECSYCYLKRMEKRFETNMMKPDIHPLRLFEPANIKKPSLIFTGSSGDMFGEWVKPEYIEGVFDICRNTHHTYQFLTKNPKRYADFNLPENGWYGTTCDGTYKTIDNIELLRKSVLNEHIRFVSFEPLLENPFDLWETVMPLDGIDWIIIGADSTKGVKKPPKEWADQLIKEAKDYSHEPIPIFIKDNYGYSETIKEMPR